VNASPDVPVLYAVSKASMTGFTIRLAAPATEQISFSWIALATNDPQTTVGNEVSVTVFPVDQYGYPISGNPIWNACIRNRTILDPEGNPFSCDRYHEGDLWHHPDLLMSFTWDTSYEPARLSLPEGYVAVTQDLPEPEASSSSSAESESSSVESVSSSVSSVPSVPSDTTSSAASERSEASSSESSVALPAEESSSSETSSASSDAQASSQLSSEAASSESLVVEEPVSSEPTEPPAEGPLMLLE